jgi:y4mF family transcriptional regulator
MAKKRTRKEIEMSVNRIARFVRERRKDLGYSQEEFAKRAGVGLRFLKELELGKESVRLDKVFQVFGYLGADLIPASSE